MERCGKLWIFNLVSSSRPGCRSETLVLVCTVEDAGIAAADTSADSGCSARMFLESAENISREHTKMASNIVLVVIKPIGRNLVPRVRKTLQ